MATRGWLPYGSDDSSVLLQIPLTASTDITGLSTATGTIEDASGEFDSVLGYTPKGAGYLKIADLTGYADLDNEGQISMEVERDWLCRYDADTWSNGDADENDTCFLGTQPTAGTTNAKFITKDSASANDTALFGSSGIANVYTTTGAKSRFLTVNIGWNGGKKGGSVWWAFDGLINGRAVRGGANPNWTNVLKSIFIGADKDGASNVGNYYCRNLQISNVAPQFNVHPRLCSVAVVSDSIMNSTATTNGTATGDYRDSTTYFSIKRQIEKRGYTSGSLATSINGGYSISSQDADGSLADVLPTILLSNPVGVWYRGGTNDALGAWDIDATWFSELTDDIDTLLAHPSVKWIVVGTVPTVKYNVDHDTAERVARVAAINAYIESLPSLYPEVFVADCYNKLGAESPIAETFIGQANGLQDNLHLAAVGHDLHGQAYAEATFRAMAI